MSSHWGVIQASSLRVWFLPKGIDSDVPSAYLLSSGFLKCSVSMASLYKPSSWHLALLENVPMNIYIIVGLTAWVFIPAQWG